MINFDFYCQSILDEKFKIIKSIIILFDSFWIINLRNKIEEIRTNALKWIFMVILKTFGKIKIIKMKTLLPSE